MHEKGDRPMMAKRAWEYGSAEAYLASKDAPEIQERTPLLPHLEHTHGVDVAGRAIAELLSAHAELHAVKGSGLAG
jgi:hypothetical protein